MIQLRFIEKSVINTELKILGQTSIENVHAKAETVKSGWLLHTRHYMAQILRDS